ncbi:mechanosensitive ion channel [Altererythrobacter confluentis]|uniref:Small-conductance mechanosensitive channel n=1 Tax=Allopontixanthobacter confluentis TaxID=1849021 RepID=A0A6L7GJW3_9SPHN|nr:mechanosensitive ion channel [Allopontixanthobacter confluentis]MXP15594.1 mechanosensitive ion channel [Allopontixanthobacter confluentis]
MNMGRYRFDEEVAMQVIEKLGLALLILIATWALAKAAKWAFAKLVDNVSFFQRHTGSGKSLGESLGSIVSLLIWLFGLLAILQVFELGGVMSPVQTLLNSIMGFVPNLVGAGLLFFVGLMIAKIVRDITITALQTVDFDKWANRGGVESATGNSAISKTIGTIIYAIIVIFVSILALDTLGLESVSAPASNMLQLVFNAIPNVIGAAILLGIGYMISKFVANIMTEVLTGLGVDRTLGATELLPEGTTATGILARVAQIAIVLFFAIAATRMLGFVELTAILDEVLVLGGRVIFGAVVIGLGFLIANSLARVLGGADNSSMAGTIVKWATIVLFTFMGLQYTGVGDIITETAFTAIVVGMAVAGALAFGLGGREWAARKLEQMDSGSVPTPTTPAAPTAPVTKPKAPRAPKAADTGTPPLS